MRRAVGLAALPIKNCCLPLFPSFADCSDAERLEAQFRAIDELAP